MLREKMETEDLVWKKALILGIKSFADMMDLGFDDIHQFFSEFVCLNLHEGADEEDARELSKIFYRMMIQGIEMRRKQE